MALSPAESAQAVIRTAWDRDRAAHEAQRWGLTGDRFDVLVKLAGQAPAPGDLAVALRRKIIDPERFRLGIAQGNLRNEWAEVVRQLAVQQPSPTAMLQAELEGQLTHAEALDRYVKLGGDPDYYQVLFDTQGQAPSPLEAAEAARRGIIPWAGRGPGVTSFEQAFLEGPWRNKWLDAYRALSQYLPPPRTITAMYREGSLSHDQAASLLQRQGVPPELVTAYLSSGSAQKVEKGRDLAQAAMLALYRDRITDRGQAAAMLQSIKYDAHEADYLLKVVDLEVAQRFMTAAVGRVHSLYVGHKIAQAAVKSTLASLKVPADNIEQLVSVWSLERQANVRTLTAADYRSAFAKGLLTREQASDQLVQLGYTAHDAWLYLSLHAGKPLPGEPGASA